jgi:ABC-2 type transport system permease protein
MWITFRALLSGALRDRISLFWAVVAPVALLLILGSLLNGPGYREHLLLGVLSFGCLGFAMTGTGFEVMRQRTKGVYKLLRATPFKISAFVSAVAGARGLVTLICALLVVASGVLFQGSDLALVRLPLMLGVLALGILCFTFLGFTLGNLAGNETEVAMLNNLFLLPQMFGSEMFYSLAKAPTWVQTLSKLLPASHLLKALQAAATGELSDLLLPLLALVGFTLLALLLAVLTFRWDPDARLKLAMGKRI